MKTKPHAPLLRPDERLARIAWPSARPVALPSISSSSCLVACAGFEDRALEVVRRICAAGVADFDLALVKYLPRWCPNRVDELRGLARNAGLRLSELTYNREAPASFGTELARFAENHDQVFVDVSGMSKLLIVQTVVAFRRFWAGQVSLLYTEAESYSPSQDTVEGDFTRGETSSASSLSYLASGVFEIAVTPELGTVALLDEAIRLVVFPSFVPAQLSNLVQELQPAAAEVVHGVPPAATNRWRTETVCRLNGDALKELNCVRHHFVSTLEYRETLRLLLRIYADNSISDRLVIAPTGSKMQSVAVGLFRAMVEDVQIVYPTPQGFADPREYTIGAAQVFQLDIPSDAGMELDGVDSS